jgi:SAM-dependent methyltransferase
VALHDDRAEPTPFDDGELYDVLFHDLAYGLDFYLDLARRAVGPVLDVACGTGRVLIPCLEAGVDVEGVDLYAGMLNQLRRKAKQLGFDPPLQQADMSEIRLARRFALVMVPFNSFGHNLTTATQIATLRACLNHLEPGGLLAFDAFFPGLPVISGPENTRVLELETKHPRTGLPVRLFDTRSFNRVDQIQRSIVEVEELDAGGNVVTTHRSTTSVRWVYKSEMELLLRVAGFARWEIFGDFDRQPLVKETDAMIVQAWR